MTLLDWLVDALTMTWHYAAPFVILGLVLLAAAFDSLHRTTQSPEISPRRRRGTLLLFLVPTLAALAATSWMHDDMDELVGVQLGCLGLQVVSTILAAAFARRLRPTVVLTGLGASLLTWSFIWALAAAFET